MLAVEVRGQPISMELDTGASVSVMDLKLSRHTFPEVSVDISGIMLHSYSGQLAQVDSSLGATPAIFSSFHFS